MDLLTEKDKKWLRILEASQSKWILSGPLVSIAAFCFLVLKNSKEPSAHESIFEFVLLTGYAFFIIILWLDRRRSLDIIRKLLNK